MSYNYINGYNVSKLDVYLNGSLIDSFTFPIENISGKKENIQDDIIEHRIIDGEIKLHYQGTHLTWEIPFDEWATLDVCKAMAKLRGYRNSNVGYRFYLTPNIDVPWRAFEVLLYNEKINLGIESANEDAPFSTGIVFGFISRYYVNENWIDKNEIPTFNLRDYKFISYT